MSIDDLKKILEVNLTHIAFDYAGKHCGVDPLAADRFDAWCGDEDMEFESVEKLIEFPFFSGKTLKEICDEIEIL